MFTHYTVYMEKNKIQSPSGGDPLSSRSVLVALNLTYRRTDVGHTVIDQPFKGWQGVFLTVLIQAKLTSNKIGTKETVQESISLLGAVTSARRRGKVSSAKIESKQAVTRDRPTRRPIDTKGTPRRYRGSTLQERPTELYSEVYRTT